MNQQIAIAQDQADRYLAAVAIAGQAVLAVRSGMGIAEIGIRKMEDGDEETYHGFCEPRRYRGSLSTLRFLLAGEAAQVALGLCEFPEVETLSLHCAAANVARGWHSYWESHPHRYGTADDWLVDEAEVEITQIIALIRSQMRRRFQRKPERNTLEALALLIRDGTPLTGANAEQFVRRGFRSSNGKADSIIPILR